MRQEVARIIADLSKLKMDEEKELTDDERRLLEEAMSRLIVVWEGRDSRRVEAL